MRPLFFALGVLLSFSSYAASAELVPRIVKVNASGFVTPEAKREEICEVYSDQVIITRTYGEHIVQKERHPVEISNLKDAILGAFNEPVSSTPAEMCDGPITTTSAEILGLSIPTLILFRSGQCGLSRLIREGANSQNLRDIIDSFCPVTHDSHNK